MPVYEVEHEDGRSTRVISSGDEATVKKQANHAETSRVIIANRRGESPKDPPSLAVKVKKVKD